MLRTNTNWEDRQGALSRSNAATARPLTLVKVVETLAHDWLNTNKWQEMVASTRTLLNIIYRQNIKLTGTLQQVACGNIRFSSLFTAGDVLRGGTSATQRQKFHTDDANQCLHNKSGSHGVPNINLSSFMCLLVGFGKVLCSSANELQQNSKTSSSSLRGRHSKGKGKGIRARDHARERRVEGNACKEAIVFAIPPTN